MKNVCLEWGKGDLDIGRYIQMFVCWRSFIKPWSMSLNTILTIYDIIYTYILHIDEF